MDCVHAPVINESGEKITCRRCGIEIFYNKYHTDASDEYVSHKVVSHKVCFDVIKFMKENKGTVAENMSILDSDDAVTYAMYIINKQKKTIRRLKKSAMLHDPTINILQKKIANQSKELARLNGHYERDLEIIHPNRKCVSVNKRFINLVFTKSNNAKITINPCDGRVELKIPEWMRFADVGLATELAKKVSLHECFKPYTYRGIIGFNIHDNVTYVKMRTESIIKEDVNFSIALL